MKYIDDCAILFLLGWLLLIGGICTNVTWLFLSGFFWLTGTVLIDDQMYKIDQMMDKFSLDDREMGK